MLDENEFLSPFGIRSLHRAITRSTPMSSDAGGQEYGSPTSRATRTAGCSGGTPTGADRSGCRCSSCSSALVNQYAHLGNDFKVECPVGSGRQLNLLEVSQEIARRLSRLFLRNRRGGRPAHGAHGRWTDEHWRDHVLFYE